MTVSFSMQPCKTKLHEIDYPHTWTSFVTRLFLFSPVTHSMLDPVHFQPPENKWGMDANPKHQGNNYVGRQKYTRVLFFCRDVRKFNNSFLRHIWDKESVRTRDRKRMGRQGWEMNFQIMSNHLAPGVPFLLSLPTLSLSLPHSILYSFSKRLPRFRLTQTIRLKVTGGRHKDILLRETVMLGCH